MEVLSVSEAAPKLGVSDRRVRQMLERGDMEGQRVGRSWIIVPKGIENVRNRPKAGRPWKPASAWALLQIAAGEQPNVSFAEASRAKRRIADRGIDELVMKLVSRGKKRKFYGHKSVLERIAAEQLVVRSGVSAAREHNADIIALDFLEAYVPAGRIEKLVKKYALEKSSERANILFRIVDDNSWPFLENAKFASGAIVAVDLLDADDKRSRRAGAGLARSAWPGK